MGIAGGDLEKLDSGRAGGALQNCQLYWDQGVERSMVLQLDIAVEATKCNYSHKKTINHGTNCVY